MKRTVTSRRAAPQDAPTHSCRPGAGLGLQLGVRACTGCAELCQPMSPSLGIQHGRQHPRESKWAGGSVARASAGPGRDAARELVHRRGRVSLCAAFKAGGPLVAGQLAELAACSGGACRPCTRQQCYTQPAQRARCEDAGYGPAAGNSRAGAKGSPKVAGAGRGRAQARLREPGQPGWPLETCQVYK